MPKQKKKVVRVEGGQFTDGIKKWPGRRRLVTEDEMDRESAELGLEPAQQVLLHLQKLRSRLEESIAPYESLLKEETLTKLRNWRKQSGNIHDQLDAQIPNALLSAVDAIQGIAHLMNSLQHAEVLSKQRSPEDRRLFATYARLVGEALRIARLASEAELRLTLGPQVLAAQFAEEAQRRGGEQTKILSSPQERTLLRLTYAKFRKQKNAYKRTAEEMTERHKIPCSESTIKRRVKELGF